jgi:hypothetical protein
VRKQRQVPQPREGEPRWLAESLRKAQRWSRLSRAGARIASGSSVAASATGFIAAAAAVFELPVNAAWRTAIVIPAAFAAIVFIDLALVRSSQSARGRFQVTDIRDHQLRELVQDVASEVREFDRFLSRSPSGGRAP